jgi:hypothetical protein
MSTPHNAEPLRPHATSKPREVAAAVVAVVAGLLTVFTVYGIIDLATTRYVGAEVLMVQVIIGVGAFLGLLAWTGAIALHKTARRELRDGPRRLLVTGMLVAVGSLVVLGIGQSGLIALIGAVAALIGAVAAVVGAARM